MPYEQLAAERKKARIKATLEARRRAGLRGLFNINQNPPDLWYQEKPGSWPGRSQDPMFHMSEETHGAKTGTKTGNLYDFFSGGEARKDRGVTEVSPQDTSPLAAGIDLTPQDTSWPPVNWNLVIGFDKKGNPIYKEDTVLQSNQDDQETAEELATPTKRLWLEGEKISLDKREPTTQAGTPQRGGSAVWGPGLTRERAEELYGPGGMYYQNAAQLDQALGRAPRSLMEVRRPAAQPQVQPTPTVRPNALDRTPAALARPRTQNDPTSILAKIDRRRKTLKGLSRLFGVKDRSGDYEARALGRYSEYMTNQALRNLTDKDLQSRTSLFKALVGAGLPPKQIIDLLPLAGEEKGKPKDQAKQVFVDSKGNEHAGKISWTSDGQLRYLKRNGSPAPDDWIPRAAPSASVTITQGGVKMGEMQQVNLARSSLRNIVKVKDFFFDDTGKVKSGVLDILWAQYGVPGTEGRKIKAMMTNALGDALRLESGAAIPPEELENMMSRYYPQLGDDDATILYKLNEFERRMRDAVTGNNPQWARENLPAPRWDPAQVSSPEEIEALKPGSYYQTPSMKSRGLIARKEIK